MKKKVFIMSGILIVIFVLAISGYFFYQDWRVRHAIIQVTLKEDLNLEVYSHVKLKDLIQDINGKIEKNLTINTQKLGTQTIHFDYINEENIRVPYEFKVKIVDRTPPIISLYNRYSVTVGYQDDLAKEFFCGDNYDDHPTCTVEGEYHLDAVGSYPVSYKAVDSSGNEVQHAFTLNVVSKSSSSGTSSPQSSFTDFADIVAQYKNKNTQIGIDVSHWQGDIDFQQVKEAGVEFVFIRVGSQKGIGGNYQLDDKFVQNVKGFTKLGIPVGVYFYTYADSQKEAKKQANWVLQQIKKYDITLPIVFDWENWSFYQEFQLSFYHLTQIANTFMDTVAKKDYQGMLYSSKNYLENMWMETNYPVWLAHYTEQTDYEGDYQVWQLCNDGKINGIQDNYVDIDILYKKKSKTKLEK